MEPEKSHKEKLLSTIYLAYFIKCKVIKKWKKMAKKSRSRYLKLRQWSETEQQYLGRLKIMRDQIKTPLIDFNLITPYEQTILFPYLDSMLQLGQMMKADIDKLIVSWHPIHTQLASTVTKLVNGLKIYKDYSKNYQKADQRMQQLKKLPDFGEAVKVPFIEDYLIKPVQRPLQYKLFIHDYMKSLPKTHKDYDKLVAALNILLGIAEEINQSVEEGIRSQKIFKLEDIFKNIVESTRKYKTEFSARCFDNRCRVYVCNNLILITKELSNHREEPLMRIPLSHGSYLFRRNPNKYFPESLYLCGHSNSIHLTFQQKYGIDQAEKVLNETIEYVNQKHFQIQERRRKVQIRRETMYMNRHTMNSNDYKWKQQYQYKLNLKVSVVGSTWRGKRLFFFTKIQVYEQNNISQVMAFELEELRRIEQYLHYVFKDINIVQLDMKCKQISDDYFSGDFTKFYEYKSQHIQNFFNSILRCQEISNRPQFLLLKMRLHQGIWNYINKMHDSEECICAACLSLGSYTDFSKFHKTVKEIETRKYPFCIIHSLKMKKMIVENVSHQEFLGLNLEERLLWADCKLNKIIYELMIEENQSGKLIDFDVILNLGHQIQSFPIQGKSSCTVRNIIRRICTIRNLGDGRDLVLTLMNNNNQEHYLNDDENIQEIFKRHSYGQNTGQKLLKRISLRSTTIFNSSTVDVKTEQSSLHSQQKICLRKMYVFNRKLEQAYCNKTFQRYEVMLGEILYRFRNHKIFLKLQKIYTACSYFYILQEFNKLSFSKEVYINEDILKHFLPEEKWNFINKEFISKCSSIIALTMAEVKDITDVYRKIHDLFDPAYGWRHTLFPIKPLDQTYLSYQNLYLGVGPQSIIFLNTHPVEKLDELKYGDFSESFSGNLGWIKTLENIHKFESNDLMMIETMMTRLKTVYEYEMKGSFIHAEREMV